MRRKHDVRGAPEQGMDLGLAFVDVEACGEDPALMKRARERRLVDHGAARGVEHDRVAREQAEARGRKPVLCLRRERYVQ